MEREGASNKADKQAKFQIESTKNSRRSYTETARERSGFLVTLLATLLAVKGSDDHVAAIAAAAECTRVKC